MKKTIFISYGRHPEKYVNMVLRIKHDLEKQGHKVWLDTDDLHTKSDWERMIEKALSENEEVVFFMTKYARRLDGFCLNEIAYAIIENKSIIPVMMELVTPPLSICRLQWLDMMNLWDIQGNLNEEKYENNLKELLDVLSGEQVLDTVNKGQSLLKIFDPQNFDLDIAKRAKGFIEREWVYAKILSWMQKKNNTQVLWITGEAGFGKTTIAANAIHKLPNVAGVFFCQYDSILRRDPLVLIKTFAYHLSTQLLDYKIYINEINHDDYHNYYKNPKDLFQKLILEPISKIKVPNENYIYIIDGLDEIKDEEFGIIHLIANEFEKLPQWIKILIVSRPEPNLKRRLSRLSSIFLDKEDSNNHNDIRSFLFEKLEQVDNYTIETILKKSEGNMLYINEVLLEIQKGRLSLEDINSFPVGLSGIYEQYFKRQFTSIENYKEYQRPLFELMVSIKMALPLDIISDILDWDEYQLEDAYEPIGSLVDISEGKIEFFHKSIHDWITDREKCSRDYFVSEKRGSKIILSWIKDKYKKDYYDFTKDLYKNFYYLNNRNSAFEIIELLINKENAKYDDILNYISMCKGDSRWNESIQIINKYLDNNDFSDLQLAYFYYIVGRVYVDDIDNFKSSEEYLLRSINIYERYKHEEKVNIVKNTLSIYYFSKGNYIDAQNILKANYSEIMSNQKLSYNADMIEIIYSNYSIYQKIFTGTDIEKITFINKEVEAYFLNNSAIIEVHLGKTEKAIKLFKQALKIATDNNKNYANAAILYNMSLLLNRDDMFNESRKLVDSMGYSIGTYILKNKDSSEHILNTFSINKKHYWVCIKNIDLLI